MREELSTRDGSNSWRKHSIAFGACAWMLFAFVAVAVRGIRWEENYEFAQVLLGTIAYPPGHPIYQHAHNSPSLQPYLTAALLWIDPSPHLACGVRNVLYALAKTLPFFLLGAAITGRARWGHAAAVLALLAGHEFATTYPSRPWPMFAGNGAVGMGAALLGLACLCNGWTGAAYGIAGLMPALHLGQCLPLFAVVGCHAAHTWLRGRREELRRVGLGLLAGLGGTVVTVLIFLCLRVPWPASGPYFDPIPPETVWKTFMTYYSAHRELVWDRQQAVLFWAALSGALLVYTGIREGLSRTRQTWMGVYMSVTALLVWGIMVLHALLGAEIPAWLIGWMPYRLVNHLIPLLVVFAVLIASKTGPGIACMAAALLCIVLPYGGEHAFLVAAAAAAASAPYATPRHPRFAKAWFAAAGMLWLVLIHQFGLDGAYFAVPFLVCVLAHHFASRRDVSCPVRADSAFAQGQWLRRALHLTVSLACLVALGSSLHAEWKRRGDVAERLTPTDLELRARAYLAEHAAPNSMIAVPVHQWRLQARLGYPVITDAATHTWLPYHARLGPTLCKLYRDLYGIDLLARGGRPTPFEFWHAHWKQLSTEQWQALGKEYDFRFVFVPTFVPLSLPVAVEDDWFRLHYIPELR